MDLVNSLGAQEIAPAQRGLHIGRVIDEHKADFDRGDFLIRGVTAADEETGTLLGSVAFGNAADWSPA